MSSSRILLPEAMTTEERLASRLAAMESRIARLEAQRELVITPLGDFSATGLTISTQDYFWRGGRLYFMWWGRVLAAPTATPTFLGINLYLNGNAVGASSSTTAGDPVDAVVEVTSPTIVQLSGAFLTVGAINAIGLRAHSTAVQSWGAQALMLEWPAA